MFVMPFGLVGTKYTQLTLNISITFVQRRSNVEDLIVQMLHKCFAFAEKYSSKWLATEWYLSQIALDGSM